MLKAIVTFVILFTVLAGFVGCIVDLERKAARLVVRVTGVDGAFSRLRLQIDSSDASFSKDLEVFAQDVPIATTAGTAWVRIEGLDAAGNLVRGRQRSVVVGEDREEILTFDLRPSRAEFTLEDDLSVEEVGGELVATSSMATGLLNRIEAVSAAWLTVREVGVDLVGIHVSGSGPITFDTVQDVLGPPIRIDIEGVQAGICTVDTLTSADANPVEKSVRLPDIAGKDLQEDLRAGQIWWTLQGLAQDEYARATLKLHVRYFVEE